MGNMHAEVYANELDLDTGLLVHLRSNHYPPVHEVFVETAKEAIHAVNDGYPDTVIEMPNGISKSAYDIADGLHLWAWIASDDEDYGW